MLELVDQEPVTRAQARALAESLSRDCGYEDAMALAEPLAATNSAAYAGRWPISVRNARLLRDALLAQPGAQGTDARPTPLAPKPPL